MGQFLSLAIFCIVAVGLALHFDVDLPASCTWVGQLPGDLILRKGTTTVYLPFITASIVSAGLCFLGSIFSRK